MSALASPDQSRSIVSEKIGPPETKLRSEIANDRQKEQEEIRHPHLPKIDEFPEKMKPVAKEVYKKAQMVADEIEASIIDGTLAAKASGLKEKVISEIGVPYGHYSTTQESASVVDDLQEMMSKLHEESVPNSYIDEIIDRLSTAQKSINSAERENETFPASRELLIHDVGFNLHAGEKEASFARERLGAILATGVLASRKYQIDHQDRSYATTGGRVVIGKDYVEYVEGGEIKRVPRVQYKEVYSKEGRGISDPKREEYQLFFGSVGKSPDGNGTDMWNPYYSKGVTFVFSKISLYSQAQFNHKGEVELYDRNFDSSSPDNPGFHINLTKEPMLVVVDEAIRDDFMGFVRSINSPLWQGSGIDVWLKDNVIFAPTANYTNDAERLKEIYKGIEARFFEKNPNIVIPQGRFMPTGNESPYRGITSIYQAPIAA